MEKRRNKVFGTVIPASIMVLILLTAGCTGHRQPMPSETVSVPKGADHKPAQESLPPSESPPAPPQPRVVEKAPSKPDMPTRVPSQPDVKESPKAELPSAEKTEQPSPEKNVLLNPAVFEDARIIQTRLAELGFYDLPVDGVWGKGSRTALMAFKEKNSLGSSDTWDNETQALLLRKPESPGHTDPNPDQHPISAGSTILDPSVPTDAKKIQTRLADLGLYEGPIDGLWGKGSRAGVRLFKEEQALKNPDTWDKETQMLLFRGTNQ